MYALAPHWWRAEDANEQPHGMGEGFALLLLLLWSATHQSCTTGTFRDIYILAGVYTSVLQLAPCIARFERALSNASNKESFVSHGDAPARRSGTSRDEEMSSLRRQVRSRLGRSTPRHRTPLYAWERGNGCLCSWVHGKY
jgi:hypothetical protein